MFQRIIPRRLMYHRSTLVGEGRDADQPTPCHVLPKEKLLWSHHQGGSIPRWCSSSRVIADNLLRNHFMILVLPRWARLRHSSPSHYIGTKPYPQPRVWGTSLRWLPSSVTVKECHLICLVQVQVGCEWLVSIHMSL
jgi:hypothetical protein